MTRHTTGKAVTNSETEPSKSINITVSISKFAGKAKPSQSITEWVVIAAELSLISVGGYQVALIGLACAFALLVFASTYHPTVNMDNQNSTFVTRFLTRFAIAHEVTRTHFSNSY